MPQFRVPQFQWYVPLALLALVLELPLLPTAWGQDASIGGFVPFVGVSLSDEFKDANTDATGTFFLADPETSLVGNELQGTNASFVHDLALLDTGAATHIFTPQASGSSGFDIDGNGFDGTNFQVIGGATGQLNLNINDPLGVFATGLANRTQAGTTLELNRSTLRGQSSFATLSSPAEWTLPNIIGLPMAAQHKIVIRNDQPQLFEHQGRTVRTPQVEFKELGSGDEGILRRTNLKLRPGASFISGPLYIQNLDILGGILDPDFAFHENPLSPTVIENGGLFLEVDMQHAGHGLEDKELLFDTGADFTVISSLTAARLGYDPLLDTPDFTLQVEGSGGLQGGVPGFYVDQLNIDTYGGSFTLHNVPVAVLDVTNPNDPGNTIDGILGMHLFNGRNLVIDANPSVGQGGSGPTLYISDPVTTDYHWASPAADATWHGSNRWSANAVPDLLAQTIVANVSGSDQVVRVAQAAEANTVTVSGTATAEMRLEIENGATVSVFGETKLTEGGVLAIAAGGKLDAQFVNIDGGTLTGSGEIFVGTGPIRSPVRNLAGRVEPGDTVGRLSIDGDYASLDQATLAIELGGTTPGTLHDQLAVDRFAFIDGRLEVSLVDAGVGLFVPQVGNSFTLLTADGGVTGQFNQLLLPSGYQWEIAYQAASVVLSVVGLTESLTGDFNGDGIVDAADYTVWRDTLESTTLLAADANNDHVVNGEDYHEWKTHFGRTAATGSLVTSNRNTTPSSSAAVPEPTAVVVTTLLLLLAATGRWLRQLL